MKLYNAKLSNDLILLAVCKSKFLMYCTIIQFFFKVMHDPYTFPETFNISFLLALILSILLEYPETNVAFLATKR